MQIKAVKQRKKVKVTGGSVSTPIFIIRKVGLNNRAKRITPQIGEMDFFIDFFLKSIDLLDPENLRKENYKKGTFDIQVLL